MANTVVSITLNDKQQKKLDAWGKHLKAVFGEWGTLQWTVSSCGIGDSITVISSYAPKHPLDLTDVGSW